MSILASLRPVVTQDVADAPQQNTLASNAIRYGSQSANGSQDSHGGGLDDIDSPFSTDRGPHTGDISLGELFGGKDNTRGKTGSEGPLGVDVGDKAKSAGLTALGLALGGPVGALAVNLGKGIHDAVSKDPGSYTTPGFNPNAGEPGGGFKGSPAPNNGGSWGYGDDDPFGGEQSDEPPTDTGSWSDPRDSTPQQDYYSSDAYWGGEEDDGSTGGGDNGGDGCYISNALADTGAWTDGEKRKAVLWCRNTHHDGTRRGARWVDGYHVWGGAVARLARRNRPFRVVTKFFSSRFVRHVTGDRNTIGWCVQNLFADPLSYLIGRFK